MPNLTVRESGGGKLFVGERFNDCNKLTKNSSSTAGLPMEVLRMKGRPELLNIFADKYR